ncbi:MAG: hypothetical protein CL885_01910 [Dehalococcoidia bacterium]|nr:hypothetical protein [Dehalococcoidia bacterium]
MLKYLPILFLSGCVSIHSPQPSDTEFDESKRDWAEVYKLEMKAAVENEDEGAYHFYFQEYMKLRIKQLKASKNNP